LYILIYLTIYWILSRTKISASCKCNTTQALSIQKTCLTVTVPLKNILFDAVNFLILCLVAWKPALFYSSIFCKLLLLHIEYTTITKLWSKIHVIASMGQKAMNINSAITVLTISLRIKITMKKSIHQNLIIIVW